MASEPVLSSEVGKRTSRVAQPVMVISPMMLECLTLGRSVAVLVPSDSLREVEKWQKWQNNTEH